MIEVQCGIALKSQIGHHQRNCKQNQNFRHLMALGSNFQLKRICSGLALKRVALAFVIF